jgi:dipeptidyl aminopeptidase/acylaminoacyl peptidase
VDPQRIAAVGTSHGALVSLLAAARTDRIKALVFAYGIADIYAWFDYLKATHRLGHDELTRRTYGSGPQHRPESFRIRYGLGVLEKLPKTMPVLILQGAQDTTVPLAQAEALAQGLKAQGQPYTLRVYPHSGHGLLISRTTLWK